MIREHGPWRILSTRTLHADPWVTFTLDEVIRPDGRPGTHTVCAVKAGVSVLALDAAGDVYLTDEFHYAVGRHTLETVSGGIDPGESAEDAARRELREELGITARTLTALGMVDPFTAMVVSPTRLFLATDLEFGEHSQEGTERIRCVKMPLGEAVRAVMDGRVTHAPSCVAILKTAYHLEARK